MRNNNQIKNDANKAPGFAVANRIVDRIIIIILAVILALGLYCIYNTLYLLRNPSQNLAYYFEGGKEDWDRLPDNAAGWLTMYHTNINYPVMQGANNEEYLNKDAFGQYSLTGSVFLDFRNKPDWSDDYNLLYGHHMASNQMFGSLDLYKDQSYMNEHKKGILKTRGADYKLTVFAVIKAPASNKILFRAGKEANTRQLLAHLQTQALLYEAPKQHKYLAMSTCQDSGMTERLIVLASMKTIQEPGTLYENDHTVDPTSKK